MENNEHMHDEHEHHDGCCCDHEHEHKHHHDDDCCCGHEHEHEHHHDDDCCCGHDHEHEHHDERPEHPINTKYTPKVYILENLGCANCAAKMESKINQLPGVEHATITFATKQLRVSGPDIPSILSQITAICTSIESEVKLVEKVTTPHKASSGQSSKKRSFFEHNKKDLTEIIVGALLFIVGTIISHAIADSTLVSNIVFVIAYIILGAEIIITAAKNLVKGQVFDENFLMTIATLGAFSIQFFFNESYSAEAVGVMLFYRIGEFFEHIAVERSRSQIMETADMRPETVNLVHDDDIQVIPAENAKVGDIVMIRPGDRIPLDGVIVDGFSRIDTSPVTGEPVPVAVQKGSEVISGCVNTSGQLQIRVEKILAESMVSRILDSVENAAASKPKIDRFITKFARIYTPIVVLLAIAVAVIPSLISGNWNYWVYTALTFLVMSCPCALVLSVPLAFFSGIGAGSRLGILFKGGLSLEALSKVKAIVMDKTGTITEGNFKVQKVISSGLVTEDILLAISASCELSSTHPIGTSIVNAANHKKLQLVRPESIEEIAGRGIKAANNSQIVLCGSRKLMEQFNIDLSKYQNEHYGTEVLTAIDGQYAGCIVISDTLKSDAKNAINQLKQTGIIPAMLTGDSEISASAIAKETGIDEVRAHLLPEDKLNELHALRNKYGSVMFVGDGINDAPVLAGADVGAAMGSGADAAIEAADVVFMTSKMQAIPQSINIAKATTRISWQNVIFALVIKICVMILGLCGLASMWMAVFADTGVAMICIVNSIRILYQKNYIDRLVQEMF